MGNCGLGESNVERTAAIIGRLSLLWVVCLIGVSCERENSPPSDQLISIGSHRLQIHLEGKGTPTVIIEAGITGVWPLEVNSNMNALELKKEYGEKLFLIGNLDKRELAKGGVDMKREVDQKVPPLKEMGGYIPGADHLIHGEFTLKAFTEYVEYIKKLL